MHVINRLHAFHHRQQTVTHVQPENSTLLAWKLVDNKNSFIYTTRKIQQMVWRHQPRI
jgi:hypothetical protein